MKRAHLLSIVLSLIMMASCNGDDNRTSLWENDPQGVESIYQCSIAPGTKGFLLVDTKDADGSKCVKVCPKSFPESELYQLYSPNSNLRVIASGAQEQCGLDGYRIDYDKGGRVCNVVALGELDDESYDKLSGKEPSVSIMKRWLQRSVKEMPEGHDSTFIKRDRDGNITSMRDIDIPHNYRARLYIKEWGPFWQSDIEGGHLAFFVMVEKFRDLNGSYVNYLYCNGKLLAELAYWKGTFIKARTYNSRGVMVNTYTDRSIDVMKQAYEDHESTPMWYVD